MKIYLSTLIALCCLGTWTAEAQISSIATMQHVSVSPLPSDDPNLERYEIRADVDLGANPCVAADSEVRLEFEIVETVAEVYALHTRHMQNACSFLKDGPNLTTLSIIVEIDPTRSLDILLRSVQTENGVETVSFREFLPQPLNLYCDPIGTMYLGGTPLFDERTGERLALEEYLASKGLDLECQPL